jgi:hypothetical protein
MKLHIRHLLFAVGDCPTPLDVLSFTTADWGFKFKVP